MRGFTPVHHAAARGHLDVLQLLLNFGWPVDVRNDLGESPLHLASYGGHVPATEFLLDRGANANALTCDGETPLFYASRKHQYRVVRMLIRRECDLSIKNRFGDLAEDEALDEKTRLEFSIGREDRNRLYAEATEATRERALTQKHRELVLAFLDLRSLCRVSQVCYRWHRATDCPALWRRLGVSRWELSLQMTVGLGAVSPMSLVAVEAFFYREPKEATKIWRRMAHVAPDSLTYCRVTFSRCQYAQLCQPQGQQHFTPPKAFQDVLPSDALMQELVDAPPRHQQHRDALARDLGIKLACGLELLDASDACDQRGVSWRSIINALAQSEPDLAIDGGEDDDDAWLFVHPDSLEDKLQRMAIGAKERADGASFEAGAAGAEELDGIAQMFNNFVSSMSGVDGVEGSESVQFDMQSFLRILEQDRNGGRAHDDDDGFFDEEDDDDDDDDDGHDDDERWIGQDARGVDVEGDDERLMREAMDEMDAELRDTTLPKTFTRLPVDDSTAPHDNDETARVDSDLNDEPQPLNLDFNLLSNLLESLASQEGMAGPVSNLLSELAATKSSP
ncbi:hypothetical protein P43SY_006977 [Pythium insidiosum]|uniref:F-box domain-containing protein n=1 Tax=Pythium insidiosum TaxID=114742 RepID=A0AAD5QDB2_PYTIN|nr:hypothetical protein P43SY_006977 [Pythium insidiosum]